MSANESIIAQLSVLENACAEIRKTLGLAELVVAPSGKAAKKAKKTKSEPSDETKEKKPSAWDLLVSQTLDEMKASGWTEWTDADGKVWPASRLEAGVHVFNGGEHDGKPVSRALGGMKRASFLKAQADPAAAEKAKAYRVKLAEKKSGSGSSTGSAEKADPVADEPGAGKRKPQSEETKAKAKATREANKAKKAQAEPEEVPADSFDEPEPAKAPEPVKVPEPVKKAKIVPKAKKVVDLLLDEWEHEGIVYYKNERGDVISMDNEWVGHWNGKEIEEAEEPADFESLTTRD